MAGTFSAVGVVALVIIGFLITAGIRRRRARKFDDEVEEAAAEAAKATDRAYMDDDDYSPGGGANSQHTGYSDVTHGTFAQQPMSVESYGMREINPGGYVNYHDIQPAGQAQADYNPYGAAGVGAVGRSKSMRDPNGSTPYNAFAQPHYTADTNPYAVHTQHTDYPSGSDPYDTSASQNRQADLLDAAGLSTGAAAGASMASNPSRRSAAAAAQERGVALGRSPSQVPTLHNGADLQRNKSISLEPGFFDPGAPPLPTGPSAHGGLVSGKSGMTGYNPPAQESYADRYAPEGLVLARKKSTASRSPTTPSRPSSMLDPYPTAPPAPAPTLSQSSHGADLIGGQRSSRVMSYGSDSDDDELPPMRPHLATHDSRASFQDAQDYGYNGGARVLRVRRHSVHPYTVLIVPRRLQTSKVLCSESFVSNCYLLIFFNIPTFATLFLFVIFFAVQLVLRMAGQHVPLALRSHFFFSVVDEPRPFCTAIYFSCPCFISLSVAFY